MDERYVEIMGTGGQTAGNLLHRLRDDASGRYFVPAQDDEVTAQRIQINALKELSRLDFLSKPGATNDHFEEQWPAIWEDLQKPNEEELVSDSVTAVFDTGLMSDHPLLQDCIVGGVDFTGEGQEDLNGHGTIVALLSDTRRSIIASLRRIPRFLNVKVVDGSGLGRPEHLIEGLRWIVQYKEEYLSEGTRVIANLSLGVYSRHLYLFRCRGDCSVCKAAVKAAEQDIWIFAAAGNKAGVTSCPAKAGLLEKHEAIFAVGASDYSQSGIGTMAFPSTVGFEPI